MRFLQYVIIIVLICSIGSCEKDTNKIKKDKLSGFVQKGPYINGTVISMNELTDQLAQTGLSFSTEIVDNTGSFEIYSIELVSSLVQLSGLGYYFNEVSGKISAAPLTLFALSDINDHANVNINILTHLEKNRIEYLVNNGMSFTDAKEMAQEEILGIFGFSVDNLIASEHLDISSNSEGNAKLIAVSVILQGSLSVGELTELLANIMLDLEEDGVLNDDNIKFSLRSSAINLDPEIIRSNLEERFDELQLDYFIPDFEKYIASYISSSPQTPVIRMTASPTPNVKSAILNATINPNGSNTNVTFEIGETADYGQSILSEQGQLSGNSNIDVTAEVSGLKPATNYHFRVRAENEIGPTLSNDIEFTTLGLKPKLVDEPAEVISNTAASLKVIVNPNHLTTNVFFEYGETTGYGNTIAADQNPLEGADTLILAFATVNEYEIGTTYHFRVRAENELGVSYSNDQSFTTYITGQTGTVEDVNGNVYGTIAIGHQIWMDENLRTTKYKNGLSIEYPGDNIQLWSNNTTGAFAYFNNDSIGFLTSSGLLYNGYAVTNSSGLCPTGWHVPSGDEWEELIEFSGGYSVAGGKLKEMGTDSWASPNTGATDEFSFSAKPGGERGPEGSFYDLDPNHTYPQQIGFWWSTTPKWNGTGMISFLWDMGVNRLAKMAIHLALDIRSGVLKINRNGFVITNTYEL